ncbi:pantothenate kinase, type III [Brevinema andersonii]|uniref:Type III pantothenate kinase n=1 Tax=Brevinema andersonii TaxID=34097 RepID=A0A1I1CZY5_BREAD|nr:type III pantothenate kinase [Brevinema andersonii]SFB68077.1 pantothenate kinase, type III [Brevinema andersonii]
MIAAFDIGNTNIKAYLFDNDNNIIARKSRPSPDLFEPERWKYFLDDLVTLNPGFAIAEKRISCVSWKIFLALRVFLGYDSPQSFNPHCKFNTDLFYLPADSPFVFDAMVPIDTTFVSGSVGSDRLLAAYSLYKMYGGSNFLASLGTATTIDLITNAEIFFSGIVAPGLDASYNGLLLRAPHLLSMSQLPTPEKLLGTTLEQALSSGIFMGHAVMVESLFSRMKRDAALEGDINLVLTGGRAYSVSPYIRLAHTVREDLVAYGLALMPSWQKSIDQLKVDDLIPQEDTQAEYNTKNDNFPSEDQPVDEI